MNIISKQDKCSIHAQFANYINNLIIIGLLYLVIVVGLGDKWVMFEPTKSTEYVARNFSIPQIQGGYANFFSTGGLRING